MSDTGPTIQSGKHPVLRQIVKYGGFALLALIVCVSLFVLFLYNKADRMIDRIGVQDPIKPAGVKPAEAAESNAKPLTLLLMGLDYRPETSSMNTDVIMAVTLNPANKSATLVSLPRDLYMKPPGLPDRKANYYFPYFYNENQSTAFAKTKQLFGDFLQLPVDYMVTIDFKGFEKAIDELGGLTIDVDMDMHYVDEEDGTNINLKKGVQHLNGKQTLDFVRYRHSNTPGVGESSDYERNRRQQQVLDQILSKLKSLGGIVKLGQVIDAVGNNMKTDIPASQIRELIKTYFGIEQQNVHYIPLEGEWISPYIYVKSEELQAAREALRSELGVEQSVPAGIAGTSGASPDPRGSDASGQSSDKRGSASSGPASNERGSSLPGQTPSGQHWSAASSGPLEQESSSGARSSSAGEPAKSAGRQQPADEQKTGERGNTGGSSVGQSVYSPGKSPATSASGAR